MLKIILLVTSKFSSFWFFGGRCWKKGKKIVSSIIRVVGGRKGKDGLEEEEKNTRQWKKELAHLLSKISRKISLFWVSPVVLLFSFFSWTPRAIKGPFLYIQHFLFLCFQCFLLDILLRAKAFLCCCCSRYILEGCAS